MVTDDDSSTLQNRELSPTYVVNVDVAVRRSTGDDDSAAGDDSTDGDHSADDYPDSDPDDEYLFIVRGEDESHAPGALGFPDGKVEADAGNENAVTDAARREVREEVGVEITAPELVTSATFESDDGELVLNLVTVADHAGGEAHPAAPDEVAAVEWRSAESVLTDEKTPPWTRTLLKAVRDA